MWNRLWRVIHGRQAAASSSSQDTDPPPTTTPGQASSIHPSLGQTDRFSRVWHLPGQSQPSALTLSTNDFKQVPHVSTSFCPIPSDPFLSDLEPTSTIPSLLSLFQPPGSVPICPTWLP